MSDSATVFPASNSVQLADSCGLTDHVLGVLPVDTGQATLSLLHDDTPASAFFNIGFSIGGEDIDLSLGLSAARTLAALITAVLPAPQVTG